MQRILIRYKRLLTPPHNPSLIPENRKIKRQPMRFLYPRIRHGSLCPSTQQSHPHRPRNRRMFRRLSLSLHRLSTHPRRSKNLHHHRPTRPFQEETRRMWSCRLLSTSNRLRCKRREASPVLSSPGIETVRCVDRIDFPTRGKEI